MYNARLEVRSRLTIKLDRLIVFRLVFASITDSDNFLFVNADLTQSD